jgi:hypothetical protein
MILFYVLKIYIFKYGPLNILSVALITKRV